VYPYILAVSSSWPDGTLVVHYDEQTVRISGRALRCGQADAVLVNTFEMQKPKELHTLMAAVDAATALYKRDAAAAAVGPPAPCSPRRMMPSEGSLRERFN
jgi:hypothetical protein